MAVLKQVGEKPIRVVHILKKHGYNLNTLTLFDLFDIQNK